MKSKKTKDLLYKVGIQAIARPDDVWVNCGKEWKWVKEYYRVHDPDALLAIGYPVALKLPRIIRVSGQATPYVSKIIGAMLDRCVVVYRAPYMQGGVHDEPMVVGKDGKLIGFWCDLNKFLADYDPNQNPKAKGITVEPYIRIIAVMGSGGITYYFSKERLNKVLDSEG